MKKIHLVPLFLALGLTACGSRQSAQTHPEPERTSVHTVFNGDSALAAAVAQVNFGPRVPGTAAHDSCAEYLKERLYRSGADTVLVQAGSVTAYNGRTLPLCNIIGRFNSTAAEHVLLAAHYDTRHVADRDPDPERRDEPIPGANDGASGVAVLLELARVLPQVNSSAGVDIIFFDVEDYGAPDWENSVLEDGGWCLGSKFWAENPVPYSSSTLPRMGVLLDMVGGRDARFVPESYSAAYAPEVVRRIWTAATSAGASPTFSEGEGTAVLDDHLFMMSAGIPTADIIDARHPATGSFPPQWHTHSDNISALSPSTMQAVGSTLIKFLENEFPAD